MDIKSKQVFTRYMTKQLPYLAVLLLFLASCQKDQATVAVLNSIPVGFPTPAVPLDNEFTQARFELGRKLFYDPILSRDSTISCGTCHQQALAFSDGLAVSEGIEQRKGIRNATGLFNLAYAPHYLREGGVPTLEMQVVVPISEHAEMDFNILKVVDRLAANAEYAAQSWACYGRPVDPFVVSRAIANFERTMYSGNSRYDQYQFQGRQNELTAAERNGLALFFSTRTNCSKCHSDFNFTNYKFENNGLYEKYEDPGRYRLTLVDADSALFKIPSLRNVAVTGPYMHNGSVKSLEAVVEHYNSGGKPHVHKSKLIQPLNLTAHEKSNLVAFLKTLTDYEFLNNPNFRQ